MLDVHPFHQKYSLGVSLKLAFWGKGTKYEALWDEPNSGSNFVEDRRTEKWPKCEQPRFDPQVCYSFINVHLYWSYNGN